MLASLSRFSDLWKKRLLRLPLDISAFPPRCFADKARLWYAEVLLPLALCSYVLYYALGGAMLSSSGRWEGIKQASPTQMTHDMALRPGPLFMASHVSEGSLPWGALQPLPTNFAQPAFSAHHRPQRHTQYPLWESRLP